MRTSFLIVLLLSLFAQCSDVPKERNEASNKRVFVPGKKQPESPLEVSADEEDVPVNVYLKETLAPIRANFKRINSMERWDKVTEHYLEGSTEGGAAYFFYADNKLEKIIERRFGETGQLLREYYLMHGELSFVYEKELRYNRPITWDEEQRKASNDTEVFAIERSEVTEERSYFKNGKLIHQLLSGDCGAPFADTYLRKEEQRLLDNFTTLLPLKQT